MGTHLRRVAVVALLLLTALAVTAPTAGAHQERESFAPDYEGSVPEYRSLTEASEVVVVCKASSKRRIAKMRDAKIKRLNERLLPLCKFRHIQAAVDHIREKGPDEGGVNLYVLPGLYLEQPSRNVACAEGYDGGVVRYEVGYECPNLVNLVGIFGDDPVDEDRQCDNPLCFLQLEGTGEKPDDVLLRGGFKSDRDWIDNHNGIKADRVDGIYIRNLAAELFRENAIYVHEGNGHVLDRTITRHNDLYGILTFLADNGLMKDCLAHHNGDGGIYPGSPPDLYQGEEWTRPSDKPGWRPAVEITRCEAHHNALGHSASAGNAIYLHDNDFHHNATGIVVDSFVMNHPGMPVDHNVFANNRVWANNENFYEKYLYSGICDRKPADRGYEDGTVCPAFPLPVGTGILIAGGNNNFVNKNKIWDNWRNGAMLFWVPAAIRGEPESNQYDVSHDNHYVANRFGFAPGGLKQPNGTDMWWDEQGNGNCWQDNTSVRETVTTNAVLPGGLPDCDSGGSNWTVGNPVWPTTIATCATFDRDEEAFRKPPGCDWFDTPPEPEGRQTAGDQGGDGDSDGGGGAGNGADDTGPLASGADTGSGSVLPATGGGALITLLGLATLGSAALVGRRRR